MHIIFSLAPLISQQFHNENLCSKAGAVLFVVNVPFRAYFHNHAYSDILWYYYILFELGIIITFGLGLSLVNYRPN
jgi:hypothetical protein